MFFNNKARFKNNYLAVAIPRTIEALYKRYEYDIYDNLKDIYEGKGSIDQNDIQAEIRKYRELIASSVFDAVESEYKGTADIADKILYKMREENYEQMQTLGPNVNCIYIIVVKCVLGEESEGVNIEETASPILDQLEIVERNAINASFDVLIDDGIITDYPNII